MKAFIQKWWPTMIVVAVILYATLSSDPAGVDELPPIPHIDKLIHAIMFGGLFAAVCFDSYRSGRGLDTRFKIAVALICLAAGAADEAAQWAMPNERSAEVLDLAADASGIVVAFFTAPPAIKKVVRRR